LFGASRAPLYSEDEAMHSENSFRTAICTDYEELLFACQKALEICNRRRDEVASLGFADKRVSDELLRLQVAFARAYSQLEAHDHRCPLCRFVSKIGSRNFSAATAAPMEKKPFA
jgi:hypothetical protein